MKALLCLALFTLSAQAGPPEGVVRIPGTYTLSRYLQDQLTEPGAKTFYQEQIARALYLVRSHPPEGVPVGFAWESRPDIGVDFYVTAYGDPELRGVRPGDGQISRMTVSTGGPEKMHFRLALLIDRIYFLPDFTPKKGPFPELLATLAYYLWGHIPEYLNISMQELHSPLTSAKMKRVQMGGAKAAAEFLKRLQGSEDMAALDPDSAGRFESVLKIAEGDYAFLRACTGADN